MGQEISESHFRRRILKPSGCVCNVRPQLLQQWFNDGTFSSREHVVGFELEAWLVDERAHPAPINQELIERLGDPLLCPNPGSIWSSTVHRNTGGVAFRPAGR